MNKRLGTIVDLEKYPIHNLESPVIKKLVEKCKKEHIAFLKEFKNNMRKIKKSRKYGRKYEKL